MSQEPRDLYYQNHPTSEDGKEWKTFLCGLLLAILGAMVIGITAALWNRSALQSDAKTFLVVMGLSCVGVGLHLIFLQRLRDE